MRIQIVMRLIGGLLLIIAGVTVIPFLYGITIGEVYWSFSVTAVAIALLGGLLVYFGEKSNSYSLRDGFLVVSAMWVLSALFMAVPFYASHIIPHFTDALFESTSGITATGASIIDDVDSLPKSFILWRSLTHWLGGMGIVVLMLAFLRNLGADSAHLFNAEASVPRPGVILPRIQSTASKLWRIYIAFTVMCCLALWLAGMNFFDSLNFTFSTIATGGFAPTSSGLFAYKDDTLIRVIFIIFMILAGGNFTVYDKVLRHGPMEIIRDYEYRMYLIVLAIGILIIMFARVMQQGDSLGGAFSDSAFMLISMQTGSGFALSDYDYWAPLAQMMLFLSTFFGGCSGSTTGGIKIIRIIILIKSGIIYLRKSIHPELVQAVRLSGKVLPAKWIQLSQQFFFLYMLVFAVSAVGIAGTGLSVGESLQCVAGILGNVGLAFGTLGPTDSFSVLHPFAKWICVVDMLLGRLELFTLLVLLHPGFWRGYFVKRHKQSYRIVSE